MQAPSPPKKIRIRKKRKIVLRVECKVPNPTTTFYFPKYSILQINPTVPTLANIFPCDSPTVSLET